MSSLSSVGASTAASTLGTLTTSSGNGTDASNISFSGLASGIDTSSLITGLLALDQSKITLLQNQQKKLADEQSAFKGIEAKVLALQSANFSLSRGIGSVFDNKTATPSDATAVAAAAGRLATPGVYSFKINSLAQAEELDTQGFASATSALNHGTLQIKVGGGATASITVDNTNDTLQGLANAINNANTGVSASIVNDGSNGTPYHILLTSSQTGAANAITITNNLTSPGGQGSVQPDFTNIVQAASDASITVGSGAGALTVTNANNTIDNVFNGLTLNLLNADLNKTVSVTVANDTTGAASGVTSFVSAFNDFVTTVKQLQAFDPQTNTGGLLLGNPDASGIVDQVTSVLNNVVAGVNGQANHLAAVGVTFADDGTLAVDQTKLTNALTGKISGVSANDVRRLFTLDGITNNSSIQFISGSDKTTSSGTPYQVNITQAASQGTLTATNSLAANIVITGANNQLVLHAGGQTSNTITLAQGTYTPAQLAQELQGEINADANIGSGKLTVSLSAANNIQLTTAAYGSAARVSIVPGGSALGDLGLTGNEAGAGMDVAGNYVVNGVTESATGSGQFLIGNFGNANTSGLQIRALFSASQLPPGGLSANVTVTRGLASQLDQLLNRLVNLNTGKFHSIDQALQSNVDDITKSISAQQAFIQQKHDQLVLQFTAMETTISDLKNIGNSLTNSLGQ